MKTVSTLTMPLWIWIVLLVVASIAIGKYIGKMESKAEELQLTQVRLDTRVSLLEQENIRRDATWGSIERFWQKLRRWIPFI